MREVIVGKKYRHFKGNLYEVKFIARDSEDIEKKLVVYQDMNTSDKIWIREYDEFNSLVDREKYPDVEQVYRFEEVD